MSARYVENYFLLNYRLDRFEVAWGIFYIVVISEGERLF